MFAEKKVRRFGIFGKQPKSFMYLLYLMLPLDGGAELWGLISNLSINFVSFFFF